MESNPQNKDSGMESPNQVVAEAYVRATAWLMWMKSGSSKVETERPRPDKIRTRKKRGYVEKYLQYLEWESKNKSRAIALLPTMSQNFSI